MIESVLAPYIPERPLPELVVEINKIYHSFEAADYDRRHPEVHSQLPAVWNEMLGHVPQGRGKWRVLDFGCGTGFEAEQVAKYLAPDRLELLVCYDPSPEMLEQCRKKPWDCSAAMRFVSSLEEVKAHAPFQLLLTNSLLHHLPEPRAVIAELEPYLTSDAVWLAGHEPSSRYYKNEVCAKTLLDYESSYQWSRWLNPSNYLERLGRLVGVFSDPVSRTASASVTCGLFRKKPSRRAIDMLVDLHVAHSSDEAREGRGFDFIDMSREFSPAWKLDWVRSYSYMGPSYEERLPAAWKEKARSLAQRFPDDGANFAAVWRRVG